MRPSQLSGAGKTDRSTPTRGPGRTSASRATCAGCGCTGPVHDVAVGAFCVRPLASDQPSGSSRVTRRGRRRSRAPHGRANKRPSRALSSETMKPARRKTGNVLAVRPKHAGSRGPGRSLTNRCDRAQSAVAGTSWRWRRRWATTGSSPSSTLSRGVSKSIITSATLLVAPVEGLRSRRSLAASSIRSTWASRRIQARDRSLQPRLELHRFSYGESADEPSSEGSLLGDC
jgi:hypothetical protein